MKPIMEYWISYGLDSYGHLYCPARIYSEELMPAVERYIAIGPPGHRREIFWVCTPQNGPMSYQCFAVNNLKDPAQAVKTWKEKKAAEAIRDQLASSINLTIDQTVSEKKSRRL